MPISWLAFLDLGIKTYFFTPFSPSLHWAGVHITMVLGIKSKQTEKQIEEAGAVDADEELLKQLGYTQVSYYDAIEFTIAFILISWLLGPESIHLCVFKFCHRFLMLFRIVRLDSGKLLILFQLEWSLSYVSYQMWGDAMNDSGSMGVIWGWFITGTLTMIVAMSLAEICSAYPTTGGIFLSSQFLCVGNESTECQIGLYFWVSRLAPGRWMPLACWLTGWFNWIGLACECMRHTAYRSMDTDILSSRYHFRWSRTFTIHSRCHQRLVCKSIYM